MAIEIIKGNTYTRQVSYYLNNSPVDLTGKSVLFMVKENINDTDQNAIISKTIQTFTGQGNNEFTLDLLSADTNRTPKKYVYEFRLDHSSNRKQTFEIGDFVIKNNVIKS